MNYTSCILGTSWVSPKHDGTVDTVWRNSYIIYSVSQLFSVFYIAYTYNGLIKIYLLSRG